MTQGESFIIFLFAEGVQSLLTIMRYPYDNRRKADFRLKGIRRFEFGYGKGIRAEGQGQMIFIDRDYVGGRG